MQQYVPPPQPQPQYAQHPPPQHHHLPHHHMQHQQPGGRYPYYGYQPTIQENVYAPYPPSNYHGAPVTDYHGAPVTAPPPTDVSYNSHMGQDHLGKASKAKLTAPKERQKPGSKPAPPGEERKRRSRTFFTREQTQSLNEFFLKDFKPERSVEREIAEIVGLDIKVVRVWFQNRRQKARKDLSGRPVAQQPLATRLRAPSYGQQENEANMKN
jgi:hypothetical protein